MSWLVPYDELDEGQRTMIEDISVLDNDVYWIRGVAGTGKTAVICHLIKELGEKGLSVCCVTFTHTLKDMIETGMEEIGYECSVYTKYHLDRLDKKFDVIFCDEVQDLTITDVKKIKSVCNNLVLAGDIGQSIFSNDPRTRELVLTENNLLQEMSPDENTLITIYRIPPSVQAMASKYFTQMFTGTANNVSNINVQVKNCDFDEQVEDIDEKASNYVTGIYPQTAIILPSHDLIKNFCRELAKVYNVEPVGAEFWDKTAAFGKPDWAAFNDFFEENEIDYFINVNDSTGIRDAVLDNKIMILTYHGSKGLDFDNVLIPATDEWMHKDRIYQKCLVALTRCKKNLSIYFSGVPNFAWNAFLKN